MKFYRLVLAGLLGAFSCVSTPAAEQPLQFEEVFRLVRTNLSDIPEEELSRIAALGFLKELGNKVQLGGGETNRSGKAVTRAAVYSDHYGYIRVSEIQSSLPQEFKTAYDQLASTNRLKGLVIDLRYASGRDYQAAAQTADIFLKSERLLLKMGGQEIRSTAKEKPIALPVALLVNEGTSGAAEALAAILRDLEAGLVIGSSPTAGDARVFEKFTLSTGQELRLGSVPVQLPDGQPISPRGLTPDIQVGVKTPDEREYYEDPFKEISKLTPEGAGTNTLAGATNRIRPIRNEADLMRRHREGISIDPSAELFEDDPRPPVVMDPVLARGLDFLKGISVLQQFRPL